MKGRELLAWLDSPQGRGELSSLYGPGRIEEARRRYGGLIEDLHEGLHEAGFFSSPNDEALRLFSVPGRSELGGNHTDHNRGLVLAASIQLDAAAAASIRGDQMVHLRSAGHGDLSIDLSNLSPQAGEEGTTGALVRGVAAEFAAQGEVIGGFNVNLASQVLVGSGLSSSAVIEVLLAKICDSLFCGGRRSPLELAKIGQRAENLHFGKPSGLMDQCACAHGGAVAIDFEDPSEPILRGLAFDPAASGFALCIVDTGGSHAGLTDHYGAIPQEMGALAAFFGKTYLREVDEVEFHKKIPQLREAAGDRAILRALHFFAENRRVRAMEKALAASEMESFLALVQESGDSSSQLLQNIHLPQESRHQPLSIALALSRDFLRGGPGAARVHGGGFAGTIQAYIPLESLGAYRSYMESVFGEDHLTVLELRKQGALELGLEPIA
ncbi:MAG: galactokinase [Treponema sp.]|nr:galactokinase [Treponema sp.]